MHWLARTICGYKRSDRWWICEVFFSDSWMDIEMFLHHRILLQSRTTYLKIFSIQQQKQEDDYEDFMNSYEMMDFYIKLEEAILDRNKLFVLINLTMLWYLGSVHVSLESILHLTNDVIMVGWMMKFLMYLLMH